MGGGKGKEKAEGRDLSDGGKDAVEVNTKDLAVAVGNEAAFKLINAAVALAFEREDHVTAHEVGMRWKVRKAHELEGANL